MTDLPTIKAAVRSHHPDAKVVATGFLYVVRAENGTHELGVPAITPDDAWRNAWKLIEANS